MDYIFDKKVVLRTPLKSIKTFFTINDIKEIFSKKEVKEALFLASPNLYREFIKWENGETIKEDKEERLIISLYKYASRMHNRCTPYGLFAKCSVVDWASENNFKGLDSKKYRSTRLDMHFSCQLASALSKMDFIKDYLCFFPNNSIYNVGNKIRYIEYYYENNIRKHQISAINDSIYVDFVLLNLKNGLTINDIVQKLKSFDNEISEEDFESFIQSLIDSQILVSELEPSVSGDEMLVQIKKVLRAIYSKTNTPELKQIITIIDDISVKLENIDSQLFNDPEEYFKIVDSIKKLLVPYDLTKLFQTDFFSNNENITIDNSYKKSLYNALSVLNKLNVKPKEGFLDKFKEKFYERYEDDEIPLVVALDNELGIGYAHNNNNTGDFNPLVNDLITNNKLLHSFEVTWSKTNSFLLKKVLSALENNKNTIQIKNKELKDFKEDWSNYSETFSIMFSRIGEKILLKGGSGPSATCLLGRFASGNKEIELLVKNITEFEANLNPNKIVAEVVHLPENRTGNILLRPSIRDYEIPYLSKSTIETNKQITVDDLYISIKDERLVLRSKKMNMEVIPRLSNAHNFSNNSLPIYHFLCDLQIQNKESSLFLNWGKILYEFPYLPRVEVDNVIISPAVWNFSEVDFIHLTEKNSSFVEKIKKWKNKNKLPKLVLLTEGDNELLVNFEDEWSIKSFISTIKSKSQIQLIEFLFTPQVSENENEEETYSNEFIAILKRNEIIVKTNETNESKSGHTTKRNFILGSEWLYYKIYCGIKTTDIILTSIIKPLTEELLIKNLITSWFFIRYADPDNHLRIRFNLKEKDDLKVVMTMFFDKFEPLKEEGFINKIQIDTYKREIERYGDKTMILSENYFSYDSANIINLLNSIEFNTYEGEKVRWLYALRAVDKLLNDFKLSIEEKISLTEGMREVFGKEFNMNKQLSKQLDKKYRKYENEIENVLKEVLLSSDNYYPISEILKEDSIKKQNIAIKILETNLNTHSKNKNLIFSYIHMLINRLFSSSQRLHELVIYDFLRKRYRSDYALKNKIRN